MCAAVDTQRIGWIGLGEMGPPIRKRLAAQGFKVTALTRNQDGRDRVARANLRGASSVRGVVDGAQIVVSAVSDDAALADIVFQDGGLAQIFVEMGTVSPNTSRRVAEATSGTGMDYVRSPISSSTALAAQGALNASGGPERMARRWTRSARARSLRHCSNTSATWWWRPAHRHSLSSRS